MGERTLHRFLAFAKVNPDAVGQEDGRQRLSEETDGGVGEQTAAGH
jgi:hypothetical protein